MAIDGIPMIQRVWQQAIESNIGEVFVACSEIEVYDLIVSNGGKAIMTDPNLPLELIEFTPLFKDKK